MRIIKYDDKYRDDMIFMVLEAKDALGKIPSINPDLLDINKNYISKGDTFLLALDDDNRVIGCVGYSKIPNTNEAFIHRLFVKASKKHNGLGSKLLDAIETCMKKNEIKVSKVHLGSSKERWYESYSFYPKYGYKEYEPRYMKKIYKI